MQNQSVERFDRPTALDESGGQKIEQRRMGRTGTADTEVVLGPHQSITKMMLPDAIDDHARRKRSGIRAGDPSGQFSSPASLLIDRKPLAAEDLEKSTWDFRAQAGRLAAKLNPRVLRFPLSDGIQNRDQLARFQLDFLRGELADNFGVGAGLPFGCFNLRGERGQPHLTIGLQPLAGRRWHSRKEIVRTLRLFGTRERVTSAFKNPVKRVVIGRRHRVELVIVAPRTTQGEPQHGLPRVSIVS